MRRALLLWRLIQPCAHQEFTEREKMLRTMRRGYMQALNFVSNLVRALPFSCYGFEHTHQYFKGSENEKRARSTACSVVFDFICHLSLHATFACLEGKGAGAAEAPSDTAAPRLPPNLPTLIRENRLTRDQNRKRANADQAQ